MHSKLDLLEADEDGPNKLKEKVQWLRSEVGHSGAHYGVIAVEKTEAEIAGHKRFWDGVSEGAGWREEVGDPVVFGIPELSDHLHTRLLRGFGAALPDMIASLGDSIRDLQTAIEETPACIGGAGGRKPWGLISVCRGANVETRDRIWGIEGAT